METAIVYYDEVVLDESHYQAVLFKIDNREVWIPRSVIVNDDFENNVIEVKEWFAINEELI